MTTHRLQGVLYKHFSIELCILREMVRKITHIAIVRRARPEQTPSIVCKFLQTNIMQNLANLTLRRDNLQFFFYKFGIIEQKFANVCKFGISFELGRDQPVISGLIIVCCVNHGVGLTL